MRRRTACRVSDSPRPTRRRGRPAARRGSASLEAAIVIPVLLVLVGLVVAVARITLAEQQVTAAAQSGARAASLERDAGGARRAAGEAVRAELATAGVGCEPVVQVGGNWSTPIGTPADAGVEVSCVIGVGDLFVPGLPGRITVTATATSPIDRYRERR